MTSMQIPILERITDAAEEPISLEELKVFLRIDGSSEDDLLTSMIKAAVISAESYTAKSIIKKKYKLSYDNFVLTENDIPKKPVINIEEVRIINKDDSVTIVDSSRYFLSSGNEKIIFDQEYTGKRIEVIFYAGYAEDKAGIPELLKQGLLNHIVSMYERKISSSNIPDFSKTLYNFYKTPRF